MTGFSLLLVTAAVLWVSADGAQRARSVLWIAPVSQPPTLEGFIDVSSPMAQTQVTAFRQRVPGDGVPSSRETTAYLSYDDENLYVVFVGKDDPGRVRARMAKREEVSSDDRVVVYLDTFADRQRAYVFAANPLGVQLDGIITEGQEDDLSFDTYWHSQGRLTATGFVVLMAIPFKSLRFSTADDQTWGIALGRITPRNNEESYWPLITKRVEGFVPQFASLKGLKGISSGRNIQFNPYALFTGARYMDADVPAFVSEGEGRAGLDAKMILQDAVTFDFTLSPDFSQVESDEPQVTVNQRFEVFFPEKRPFFNENAGLFQAPINLFFSRRIVDPQFGVRVSGKAGGWTLGALVTDDRAQGGLLPESDRLRGRRAGAGVVRVQHELFDESTVGLLITRRNFSGSFNRVYSLDTRLKLSANWVLTGQAVTSTTRELDGTRLSGRGYFAELTREGRHFEYFGRYKDFAADFRSALGFVPRLDFRETEHRVKYRWRPESSSIVKFGPTVRGLVLWNRDGVRQDWTVDVGFDLDLTGSSSLEIERTEAAERFGDRDFRKHTTSASFSTEWLKWLSFASSFGWGTNVNFNPPPGIPSSLANELEGGIQITLRPTPRLRVDQTYIYTNLKTRSTGARGETARAETIFDNHLARLRFRYQVTRNVSLRALFDYEAVRTNPSLVDLEREKHFGVDLLLTYLVNPGTALFVGYVDNYENLDFAIGNPSRLRRTEQPTTSVGRQLFVKVSYVVRF